MKSNILRALSDRSFLYLWLGEIFTQISINLFNFFAIIVVFKATQSNTAVSGIVLSFMIPALLFGSLAGAYVDRWNKKNVLIVTNILRGILLLVLALSFNNLWMLYILGFLIAVLTQFFIPAETPVIPLVTHRNNLLSANALFGIGLYASILIAYVLSGPLILFLKPVGTLIALAGMLFIGAGIISLIKLTYSNAKPDTKKKVRLNIFAELKHAIDFMYQTKEISRAIFLLALAQVIILVVATIAPGYASQVLKINVEDFSILFVAPAALGVVVGAVALVNFFHSYSKNKIINLGIFLSGLAVLLLPYGSKVASKGFIQVINSYLPEFMTISIMEIMVVIAFVLGVSNAFVFVSANTILQENTSEEFRGRMYGFLNTIVGILSLLPVIIVGGLSDLIGVSSVLTGIGLSLLGVGVIRLFLK